MIDKKAIDYAIKRVRDSIDMKTASTTDARIPFWEIIEEIAQKWNVDNETALAVVDSAWKKVTAEGYAKAEPGSHWEQDKHHGWEGDDMIQGDLFKENLKTKLRPLIREILVKTRTS